MSLWDLLIVTSSAAFVGSALAAARVVNGSTRDYVVATISGLLLAIANAWTWSKVGNAVDTHVKSFVESHRERYLRNIYIAAAIWAVCAGILGMLIASAILRVV
jgi:hypothetical protein